MLMLKTFKSTPSSLSGLSLVELMISLVVGLVVVGGVINIFSTTIKSNADMLKATRLNQELRVAMDMMARDIRLAGYRGNPGAGGANKFTSGNDDLLIDSTPADNEGTCITYTYDLNSDEAVNPGGVPGDPENERYGFRFSGESVSMRKGGTVFNCTPTATTNSWEAITDPEVVNISALNFTLSSSTVDISGGGTRTIRSITIKLTGNLKKDPNVKRTLEETVRIQNDKIT